MAEPEDQGGVRIGSGLTDADGNASGHDTAHVAEGLDFLPLQYRDKPRLAAFLSVLLGKVQEVEDFFWDLFTMRTLDTAEGVQLDTLGKIVGEPRKERTDETYRRFIRVRILVNRSNGQISDLYGIALLSLAGTNPVVRITEEFPAGITVHVDTPFTGITTTELVGLLREAKSAAIRLGLITTTLPTAGSFTWGDSSAPLTDGSRGWGSTTDPTLGGAWSSVI